MPQVARHSLCAISALILLTTTAVAQQVPGAAPAPMTDAPVVQPVAPATDAPQAPAIAPPPAGEAPVSQTPAAQVSGDNAATSAPAAGAAPGGTTATATEAVTPTPAPTTELSTQPAPSVPELVLPHDLSPWGMFMAADWVVKAVMIGLAFASLVTWTVALVKILELLFANRNVSRALSSIQDAQTLEDALRSAQGRSDPASFMLRAAHGEYQRSARAIGHSGGDGVKERVGSLLGRIEGQAVRRLNRGTGLLATIGSTAPFVGLFGTVWGIMNSFIGISESQTTNLAVVAPGIAEALLATAIGLVAAIPAVIIYNVFARGISGYRAHLGDAAAGIERLVSRDIDFRGLPRAQAAE